MNTDVVEIVTEEGGCAVCDTGLVAHETGGVLYLVETHITGTHR